MSKTKADPANINELVNKVAEIVGPDRSHEEIRKELAHRSFNVNLTATAFLDSMYLLFFLAALVTLRVAGGLAP